MVGESHPTGQVPGLAEDGWREDRAHLKAKQQDETG